MVLARMVGILIKNRVGLQQVFSRIPFRADASMQRETGVKNRPHACFESVLLAILVRTSRTAGRNNSGLPQIVFITAFK